MYDETGDVEDEVSESSGTIDGAIDDDDECCICSEGGDLILCDHASGCPLAYHMECLQLRSVPEGDWICPAHGVGGSIIPVVTDNSSSGSDASATNESAMSSRSDISSASGSDAFELDDTDTDNNDDDDWSWGL